MVGGVWCSSCFYKDCLIYKKFRSKILLEFYIRVQMIKIENFEFEKSFFYQIKVFGYLDNEIDLKLEMILINEFKEIEYFFNFRGEI